MLFLCAFCVFAENSFAQNPDFLAETVKRGNVEQKREALRVIRNLESETASRLAVPALRDSAEIVRATAAFAVIFLPPGEALAVLSPLLSDKKELVRREATYALGEVRNPNAVARLLQVFEKDKIAEVRNAAIVALGEIGDAAAIDVLTGILRRKPKRDDEADDFLRRAAARSVGQIAQIIQTGKTKVVTPQKFPTEQTAQPAPPNFPRLAEQFPIFRPAINVLINVLQNAGESGDARREAAFALGAIGDAAAIPALRLNLNNPDYYLAEISREA
ncbi:MAG TPA: HEAT repeat domain-containing protein, partial [Pyrinomonadaceae bacterium]